MGIFDAFGFGETSDTAEGEQSVVVHFRYGSTDLGRLFEVEDKLEKALRERAVGEVDGNEVAVDGSDGFLYMYGADADALFAVARPILDSFDFMKGATVKLVYGPPGPDAEERFILLGG